ncbi:MAG: DUF2493 domain-containing protein [Bacteroidota bacterium]
MTILITGSRSYQNKELLEKTLTEMIGKEERVTIAHGGAKGADQLANQIARERGYETKVIKPNYEKYGSKAAPLKRNTELVKTADCILAAYGAGRDRKGGTWDTAQKALAANKLLVEIMSDGTVRKTTPQPTLF